MTKYYDEAVQAARRAEILPGRQAVDPEVNPPWESGELDLSGPALIVQDERLATDGNPWSEYSNQTDGCACNHPEAGGVLIVLEDRQAPCFCGQRWYFGVYGIDNVDFLGVIYGREYPRYLEAVAYRAEFGWPPAATDEEKRARHMERADFERDKALSSAALARVRAEIEVEVREILPLSLPGATDFVLGGGTEAWMQCAFTLDGERVSAILTWANSD